MANASEKYNDNIVTLQSSDGLLFQVDKAAALKSNVLKMAIDGGKTDTPIRLPNVSSHTLKMVIDYCQYHQVNESPGAAVIDTVKIWDAEFIKALVDDVPKLLELTMASDYLEIFTLLDLTSQTIADIFTGKSPEEIRRKFNIQNDFSPEAEAAIIREHQFH